MGESDYESGELGKLILAIVTDLKMDKVRLDKLIESADDQDKITLKVLYNAVVTNLTAYNAQKTSARLKDWRNAESALLKTISEMESKYFPTNRPLPNLLAVVDWLKHHGWKVSKSKVYADAKSGKIPSLKDGTYAVKSIESYAGNHLRQKGAFAQRDEALGIIAEQKAKAEADKLQSQAGLAAIKLKIAQGQYVDKGYFDQELSKRAAIFRSDLEGMVRSKASDIAALVVGDAGRIPELIEYMLLEVETVLARYSEEKPIDVPMIDDSNDDEAGQDYEEEDE